MSEIIPQNCFFTNYGKSAKNLFALGTPKDAEAFQKENCHLIYNNEWYDFSS